MDVRETFIGLRTVWRARDAAGDDMRFFLASLSIPRLLQLLCASFAVGAIALAGFAVSWQWSAMRQDRISELRALTEMVHTLAEKHRQDALAGRMTEAEAKARTIADAIAMRHGHNDYITITSGEGMSIAHPIPSNIGVNLAASPDSHGFYFLKDVMPRAKRDGVAVVEYYFPRASGGEALRKLGVYNFFEEWDWYIGAGLYTDDLEAAGLQSALRFFGVCAGLLVLLSGFAVLVVRAIKRPLLELRANLSDLASGKLEIDIPLANRRHEIGDIGRAVKVLQQTALDKQRTEAALAAERQRQADEAHEAAESAQATVAQQYVAVEGIGDALARLSEGDLTCQIETEFAPAYERLRTDFNAAVGHLQSAMQEIMTHSQAIGQGTGEIASAADDLARRTEQQAASLEQTAAALGEITATVRQTASGSNHAQQVVATTKSEAEQSAKVMQQAVTAMGAIESSARKIGQIIGVIDEIAFQTNLLALNAGVEAARAGEAGRGFAVVATEVRALAQRAAEAAKEIKVLVTTSMQQVEQGVRLVGETGTALGAIQSGVDEINGAIREIAASAAEQANGLAEVNTAVNQMDQMTQQNAAMVEQNTAATHSLSQETNALNTAMARFRIERAPTSRHGRKAA
jgi:methyl-accepting chemotaxis protein